MARTKAAGKAKKRVKKNVAEAVAHVQDRKSVV
jgi:hypothetical protein